MRFSLLLTALPLALADAAHWAREAANARDGVITLTGASYDTLMAPDRDYGVTVVLTALKSQFKCAPCQDFDPTFHNVALSWRKKAPKDERDEHFFASLEFDAGSEIFQRLGLTTAPTVFYYPPVTGERKAANPSPVKYDLNRNGLGMGSLHNWVKSTTPVEFGLYKPFNPVPFIVAFGALVTTAFGLWTARGILIPIITSRIVWGVAVTILCILWTSGYMWNKIKNAPYVHVDQNGKIAWVAGGYSNQLGLESQVVGALYAVLALTVVVLSVFIPAQSNPIKQRVGTFLWLLLLIVLYSLLIRLFRMKNGSYPFHLL